MLRMSVLTDISAQSAPLIVRDGLSDDWEACLHIDPAYSTEHVWQMERDAEPGRVGVTFRTVRLPRPMRVVAARDADAIRQAWAQRDCFLVALVGGQVRGYLTMQVDMDHYNGWVRDFTVDAAWRRRGIGGALLKAARQWAREHRLSHVTIETQTKNYPAIRFCEKYGLAFSGFNDNYYPNQDIALFFAQRP